MPEITKVQITIRKFLFETRKAMRDPQKALEWLRSFRETLEFQDLVDSPNAYALAVIEEARNFNDLQKKNSQMKQVKRALGQEGVNHPTRAQIESKWRSMYLTADAHTREDGEFKSDSGDAGNLESATSAGTVTLDSLDDKRVRPGAERASAKPSRTTPPQNSYGEFGNVKMTTAEFSKLVQAEGADRANALIEELSSYLASSGKRYKSHYATLLNWGRRKEKEDAPKQKFLTTEEISRRNYEQSQQALNRILEERRHG